MSILMRVRLFLCGVAMKIPPVQIKHMKMPHNSMQMWNMALTVIIPPPPGAAYAENLSTALRVMIPLNGGALPRNDKNGNS